MKKTISAMLEEEQLDWLLDQIRTGRFASLGHGLRVAIQKLIDESQPLTDKDVPEAKT